MVCAGSVYTTSDGGFFDSCLDVGDSAHMWHKVLEILGVDVNKRICGSILLCALFAFPTIGSAQGASEISGRLSYSDISAGDSDITNTDLIFSYGRYLTKAHQIGFAVSYTEQEIDGFSVDGSSLGVFYTYNFVFPGIYTPFVGINFDWVGGDIGDVYDYGYGATIGYKIYPFEHAGFEVGVTYQELSGSEGIADADGISFTVGLLIRF